MKVSEITTQLVAEYLRLDWANMSAAEKLELDAIIEAAKTYATSFTGQTLEALDDFPDVVIAIYVLCQDMYDNRSMYAEAGTTSHSVNRVIDTILGMHSINLL